MSPITFARRAALVRQLVSSGGRCPYNLGGEEEEKGGSRSGSVSVEEPTSISVHLPVSVSVSVPVSVSVSPSLSLSLSLSLALRLSLSLSLSLSLCVCVGSSTPRRRLWFVTGLLNPFPCYGHGGSDQRVHTSFDRPSPPHP